MVSPVSGALSEIRKDVTDSLVRTFKEDIRRGIHPTPSVSHPTRVGRGDVPPVIMQHRKE
jgi:hypothetical protein